MLTSDTALRKQHRTVEMATNDTKMGSNCESDGEKRKYNSKMSTAIWISPQYTNRQVSKFRLYLTDLPLPPFPPPQRGPQIEGISYFISIILYAQP